MVHLCMVNVITDCDEKTVLKISGVSESDAMATAMRLINGGGHIVLGADNNGKIFGVSDESLQEQLDTLAKDMNNPQLFKPTYYLDFKTLKLDGLNLIHCYVPESTQAHTYKGEYYDRNRDGDFILRSTEQIANLFIRKSKLKTEDRVYPVFGLKDLDEEAMEYMRLMIKSDNPDHEWLKMDNGAMLRSGQMIMVDPDIVLTSYVGYRIQNFMTIAFRLRRTLWSHIVR